MTGTTPEPVPEEDDRGGEPSAELVGGAGLGTVEAVIVEAVVAGLAVAGLGAAEVLIVSLLVAGLGVELVGRGTPRRTFAHAVAAESDRCLRPQSPGVDQISFFPSSGGV